MSDFYSQLLALGLVLLFLAIGIACVAVPFAQFQREEQARWQEKQRTGELQASLTNARRNQQIREEIARDVEELPAQEDDPHGALTMSNSIVHRRIEERYWQKVILPNYDTQPMMNLAHVPLATLHQPKNGPFIHKGVFTGLNVSRPFLEPAIRQNNTMEER